MAAKRPAIETRQGHPQGIVDDVLIPIAKKVIRKVNKKTPVKGMYKEVDMITKRHNKLIDKKRSMRYNSALAPEQKRINKKIKKNLNSGNATAKDYGASRVELGLPTSAARVPRKPSPLMSQAQGLRAKRKAAEAAAIKRAKTKMKGR